MTMNNWACIALLALGMVEESSAFVPAKTTTIRHFSSSIREEKARFVTSLTTKSVANGDSDEDFVFITPQALYTEDPNDQRYSASDWLANVKSLPRSTILRAIQGPVISVMAWTLAVSLVHGFFKKLGPRGWAEAMCISSKPHSFLVSALGLLLVFRTNSAVCICP